jgi:NAD(P)-dependent dehydrogenase (short-subunit alcohol dehydrogenase family)
MPRTILITGASGNLGKEVVQLLHAEGHTLLATYHLHEPDPGIQQQLAFCVKVNLQEENETNLVIQNLTQQFPNLDAALLLAGGYEGSSISNTTMTLINNQFAQNFKTAWNVARPMMDHFKKKGQGQFVLMGSRPALSPEAGKHSVAYALSKSLLFSLSDIINAEAKGTEITSSVVVPSTMDTPSNRNDMPDADFSKWVKAEDVAKTISFILSDVGRQMRQAVYKIYNKA